MRPNQHGMAQILILIGLLIVTGAIMYKYLPTSSSGKVASFFDRNLEVTESQLKSTARDRAQDLVAEYTKAQVNDTQNSYDEIAGMVKGDLSKAAKYAAQKSTPLSKTDPEYYLDAGDSSADEGNYEEAEDNYEKYVELEPDSVEGYCALGTLYQQKGESGKAKELLQKALDLLN